MNRRRQPHRIPPPISHGAESLDAEIVLHEFPDDVGLCLWKTVRTIRLWSGIEEDSRREAFSRDAFGIRMERLRDLPVEADVRELLETAATVLRDVDIHEEAVVTACCLLARWAEERGALGTALEFAQVAALLNPGDAELVHGVAKLARRRGEYARAESWYRQAVAVSRRTHDWISLAGSYLGLGATFLLRGNHGAARQTLVRGIRAAERHSLREERALLSHQLAVVAARTERPAEAVRHARAAFDAYGAGHPQLPALAVDLATSWARMGYPAEAERVLRAVAPSELEPAERLARWAALAVVAAALGDRSGYEEGRQEATRLLADGPGERAAGEALLDLAHAAAYANDRERLHEAAKRLDQLGDAAGGAERRAEAATLLEGKGARGSEPGRKLSRDARRLASDLAAALSRSTEVVPTLVNAKE